MTDQPSNLPPPDDGQPSNPFADLQAELEDLGLTEAGQPQAEPPPARGAPRLCPGCNGVYEFADGRCLNCGYQLDAATPHGAEAAYLVGAAYDSQRSPLLKVALVLLALVLIGIAGWFSYPTLFAQKERRASDASLDVSGAAARAEAEQQTVVLQKLPVDDALKTRISSAIREANKAWSDAGTGAYVYRYSISEHSGADLGQSLRIEGYVAGENAVLAVNNEDRPFMQALEGLLADLNAQPGVTVTFQLLPRSEEPYEPGDIYVIYGTDYGLDHMEEIQPVIDAIENFKHEHGQYPLALDGSVIGNIRTKGNPQFTAGGFGYIPIFKTDSAGNVVMGTGAGIKKMQPEAVTGYYLLKFLNTPEEGLDLYSDANLNYYTQKISPFPYQPSGKITNMPLTPDGEPDGVAAIVKNGKLQ